MAEDDPKPDETPEDAPPEDAADDDAEAPVGRKAKQKKLLILGGAGAAALVLIVGAAMLFLGGDDKGRATVELAGPPVFHEMPSLLADLKTGRCRAPYLKVAIVVEIPQNQLAELQAREVEIIDAVQAELRETERQDLVGKGGADRLRERVLLAVNGRIAPSRASGILFREFLLQ